MSVNEGEDTSDNPLQHRSQAARSKRTRSRRRASVQTRAREQRRTIAKKCDATGETRSSTDTCDAAHDSPLRANVPIASQIHADAAQMCRRMHLRRSATWLLSDEKTKTEGREKG